MLNKIDIYMFNTYINHVSNHIIAMALLWYNTGEYLEGHTSAFKFTDKFAFFDLDGTLIKTKSGHTFPKNGDDWVFLYDNVVSHLQQLSSLGYCVAIISNQRGIENKKTDPDEWMKKLNNIAKQLDIKLYVFAITGKNKFQKPYSTWYEKKINNTLSSTHSTDSFYCGDACGRKYDHSDCDYKFALNCGIVFKTPEQVFLNTNVAVPPIVYPNITKNNIKPFVFKTCSNNMCIMVGIQASGKSWLAKKICNINDNYVIVNQDTLKTKAKCIAFVKNAMKNKKCVIIDNTNPSVENRKQWIDIASLYSYNIIVLHVTTSFDLAMHRNHYRFLKGGHLIPSIAYNMYKKNFIKPSLQEGINEIYEIEPDNADDELYKKYLY